MKHVFLYAYDKVNFGDDLFIRTITGRYPDTKFYLWSDSLNQKNFADVHNLTVIDQKAKPICTIGKIWPSFPSRYRTWIEDRCDAVVYIGGSIFMEYPQWERYVMWWKAKALRNRMYVLGANWGPYSTPAYKDGIAEAFASMQDVCFRDYFSQKTFEDVPCVRYAPDILFSYPMPQCQVKEKQIFVSLIHCGGDDHAELCSYKAAYIDNMSSLLKRYLEDGCSIILASFCKHEGDDIAVSEILGNLITDDFAGRISTLSYDGTNGSALLNAISESDYVIASRFHGVILALAAGRPVLPVIYSDKTLHTLDSIGFQGGRFDLRSAEPISYEESKENWSNSNAIQMDALCAAAQKHFLKLDLMLK